MTHGVVRPIDDSRTLAGLLLLLLEFQPGLSDAALSRMLTERAKVAISRRTVAKYRMDLGIRRQGTLTDAIVEVVAQNPDATDAELAAMLTASTGRQVSAKVGIWNRLRLGLRKKRERRKSGQVRRPLSPEARNKRSEAMKRHHATNPMSETTRQKIATANKRHWAEQKGRQAHSPALLAAEAHRPAGAVASASIHRKSCSD